jgi:2-C-methyl-D-erythritol 2,4-cyclodiphosphate synthase
MLGGVAIPFEKGPVAHSDGDVLLHALCDALLGAAALGDIGKHFPDSAPEFKGISSVDLLRRVVALVREHNYTIVNVDVTVVLERPKIGPHIIQMTETLAPVLQLSMGRVSIKATTNEGIGGIGAGEAIAAFAVAQIESALSPHS